MQNHLSSFPGDSGRLVIEERTRDWATLFLNRLRQTESPGQKSGHIDPSLLVEQAVFVASPDELRRTLENHPASFVFAEVTVDSFRELLGQIPRFRRSMPRLQIAVVCFGLPERPVDEYDIFDSLFREAGATAVLATQRDLLAMIPAVVTHFANLPQQEIGWRESIEQRLPWRKEW